MPWNHTCNSTSLPCLAFTLSLKNKIQAFSHNDSALASAQGAWGEQSGSGKSAAPRFIKLFNKSTNFYDHVIKIDTSQNEAQTGWKGVQVSKIHTHGDFAAK